MLKKIFPIAVFLYFSQPNLVFAGMGNEERLKLLGEITAYQDNFVLVRDRFFLGPHGLGNDVKTWSADVQTWLDAWDQIWLDVKGLSTSPQFDLARIAIEGKINDQVLTLAHLRRRAEEFSMRSDNVKTILFSRPKPAFEGELFEHRVADLVLNNGRLSEQISEIQKSVVERSLRLNEVSVQIVKKLDAYVTLETLKPNPALKEKFAELKARLTLMAAVGPYKSKLYEIREKMANDLYNSRVFHAETYLTQTEKALIEGQNAIAITSGLNPALIAEGQASLAEISAIISKEFNDLAGPKSERAFKVRTFVQNSRKNAYTFCKGQVTSVNCEMAEWLDRIPISKIPSLSENKLRAIEIAWEAVLNGQSTESLEEMKWLVGGNKP